MKNYLLSFSLFWVLISCSNPKEVYVTDCAEPQYRVEIPTLADTSTFRYSELFSDVRYVTLESSSYDAIIGHIAGLEICNNKDLIILDGKTKKVARFDSSGHFLNLIGTHGHGPGEYIHPISIAYDKYEDQVIIGDWFTKKLLYYQLNGKHVKTLPLSANMEKIKVIDKNHILTFSNYRMADFNYYIFDTQGNEVARFDSIMRHEKDNISSASTFAICYGDEGSLICRPTFSSIIYKVKDCHVSPFIEIVPNDDSWRIGRPEDLHQAIQKEKTSYLNTAILVNNKLIMTGYLSAMGRVCFLYSDLHNETHGGTRIINDLLGAKKYDLYLQNTNKEIYYTIRPEECQALLDSWKDRTDIPLKDRELVTQMANSINPIIQICTVKD